MEEQRKKKDQRTKKEKIKSWKNRIRRTKRIYCAMCKTELLRKPQLHQKCLKGLSQHFLYLQKY
jgi:hypothetical protein